jgi:hypothetical protein
MMSALPPKAAGGEDKGIVLVEAFATKFAGVFATITDTRRRPSPPISATFRVNTAREGEPSSPPISATFPLNRAKAKQRSACALASLSHWPAGWRG